MLLDLRQLSETKYANSEYGAKALERLAMYLARDGFRVVDGRVIPTSTSIQGGDFALAVAHLDAPELHRQLERIQEAVENDPPLAIGTAKELIESACKTVLEEHSVSVDADWKLGRLVKEARTVLNLLPEDIPADAKGTDAIQRLLANLGAIAQSLGELRNLYGTGHGRRGSAKGLSPRHARLAVGAAATLVVFLLETHWHHQRVK